MKRHIFDNLMDWKNKIHRKPLILKGARQVGKTYILKEFGRLAFSRTHYINFEENEELQKIFEKNLNPKRILQEFSFFLNTSINLDSDLLIMDEIQACPRALTSLKYFNENCPDFAICTAGSLLGIQLSDFSYPVGKVEHIDMYPMSFQEFLLGIGEEKYYELLKNLTANDTIPETAHSNLWEYLKYYFVVGGLPEVVRIFSNDREDLYKAFENARKCQTGLIRDYMADIAKHSGKQNAMHIERLWRNVPSQLAKDQNASAPKFKFKGVVPGVNSYTRLAGAIDWLTTAGLIIKVHIVNTPELPFSAYEKENQFKLFCFDVGLLGAMSGLVPKTIFQYDYGTYKGYFAENYIAQEFKYSGINELHSWKKNTAEIEFIIEINGDVIPVEVKSGFVTQAKSLKVFVEKYSPAYRTIISAKNLKIDDENKIHQYPLYLASRFPMQHVCDM